MSDFLSIFSIGLFQNTLRTATPVVLAALGILMTDHVGIMNKGRVLLERSLSELQDNTVKLQVAYAAAEEPPLPEGIRVLHRSAVGRVITYIVRGSREEVLHRMQALSPLLLEAIPLTLEEIFIYELGGADYAVRDIVL